MTGWNLDDGVLEAYIEGFYGHGRYSAPYWFIGMEFGGGNSEAEIVSRIEGWYDRGGEELEELGGDARWFRGSAPLQPTWKQLMRIVLSAEGLPVDNQALRDYQKTKLGRAGGLDCILELLPLPSPGLDKWLFYPQNSRLSYLKDRVTYASYVMPGRIEHLRRRVQEHQPGAVVFYGKGYEQWWRAIAGVDLEASGIERVSVARVGGTLFVSMPHPTARGLPNAYFEAIGRLVGSAGTVTVTVEGKP
jgi:hypothetical protein